MSRGKKGLGDVLLRNLQHFIYRLLYVMVEAQLVDGEGSVLGTNPNALHWNSLSMFLKSKKTA